MEFSNIVAVYFPIFDILFEKMNRILTDEGRRSIHLCYEITKEVRLYFFFNPFHNCMVVLFQIKRGFEGQPSNTFKFQQYQFVRKMTIDIELF